jgi:hypothetical protein
MYFLVSNLSCFKSSLLTSLGLENIDSEEAQSFPEEQFIQPQFVLASPPEPSDSVDRRPSSLSPNQMRLPVRRDRTPIQRSRRSIPRGRSHSRPDLLLPYATEHVQIHQPPTSQAAVSVVPSQSAPTTPQIFPLPPGYPASSGIISASFGAPVGYFPAPMVQGESEELSDFEFHNDQQFDDYYLLSRSASSSVGVPDVPHEGYIAHEASHGLGGMPSMPAALVAYPSLHAPMESTVAGVGVLPSRPKPQCWDHGCNGRQFSTFSNLLRHQREKSGSAMKAICPYCGTEFTRTTARNGHMYGGKCRAKESSEPSPEDSSKS